MLLPSALPCDVRRSSRFTPVRLFSTPPPADRDHAAGNSLLGTCRALQSLLNGSPAPSARRSAKPQRLQSPLPINPPRRSPRLRKTARLASPRPTPPTKITRTPPPPPSAPARGANKRRRDSCDDNDSDADLDRRRTRLSTPKRRRRLPYDLPLGLSSMDFYSLHSPPITQSPPSPHQHSGQQHNALFPLVDPDAVLPSIETTDNSSSSSSGVSSSNNWSIEEDEHLIGLVLENFRLSQQEWHECAQQMGRQKSTSVGHRWDTLVGEGRVGLRRGGRR